MNWRSPAEFFAMGHYGLYVWGSVLACLASVFAEIVLVRRRYHGVISILRKQRLADKLELEEPAV